MKKKPLVNLKAGRTYNISVGKRGQFYLFVLVSFMTLKVCWLILNNNNNNQTSP